MSLFISRIAIVLTWQGLRHHLLPFDKLLSLGGKNKAVLDHRIDEAMTSECIIVYGISLYLCLVKNIRARQYIKKKAFK